MTKERDWMGKMESMINQRPDSCIRLAFVEPGYQLLGFQTSVLGLYSKYQLTSFKETLELEQKEILIKYLDLLQNQAIKDLELKKKNINDGDGEVLDDLSDRFLPTKAFSLQTHPLQPQPSNPQSDQTDFSVSHLELLINVVGISLTSLTLNHLWKREQGVEDERSESQRTDKDLRKLYNLMMGLTLALLAGQVLHMLVLIFKESFGSLQSSIIRNLQLILLGSEHSCFRVIFPNEDWNEIDMDQLGSKELKHFLIR
ncbi:hypothetical protein PPACK8108_LOCUS7054 [Phakopsora pachyrhizi]|uniref:Uncharacterized protein n=1 Tax=Phakopsora pachyrhizi TaxID=170000 RepID=A0AAV0ATX3_PHAPC|nr:hypothetical protein PPACK8108_LOCUS7054 [Phakopsora pachyrhizi]